MRGSMTTNLQNVDEIFEQYNGCVFEVLDDCYVGDCTLTKEEVETLEKEIMIKTKLALRKLIGEKLPTFNDLHKVPSEHWEGYRLAMVDVKRVLDTVFEDEK